MYILKTEHSFDSAHFLANYKGKCGNIHGHRWTVEIEIKAETLIDGGQLDGMVVDFGDLKTDLKKLVDSFDHALIIQENTMREATLNCIKEDGFNVIMVAFRPTAENFAQFFYNEMKKLGYQVRRAVVYETPTNSAIYEEGSEV
jgi:6-pyruvoyltetrahydropterin/6-carboxytetrahydropterin synthase